MAITDPPLLPPIPIPDIRPGDHIAISGTDHEGIAVVKHVQPNPDGSTTISLSALVRRDG